MPLKHRPRSDTPVTMYVDGLLLAHLLSQQGISDEGVIPEIIARKLTHAAGGGPSVAPRRTIRTSYISAAY